MRRAFFLIVQAGIAIAAALFLVEHPGSVTIEWLGYQAHTEMGVLVLAVLIIIILAALFYRAWRALLGAPGSIARNRSQSRRMRGYQALTQGMVAVAAGDVESASKLSRKADTLLDEPPLTMLLAAQAAQLHGDDSAAARYFERMLERSETEFLALRGLLSQAMRDDDNLRALELAQRARAIRPMTPWVIRTCLELEVRMRRWVEAQDSLVAAQRAGLIDAETARRQKTAVLIERSREAEAAENLDAAQSLAHQATGLSPLFVPAVLREAHMLERTERGRQAAKLIERTWPKAAHPDLADIYLRLDRDEDPLVRLRRAERLYALAPNEAESGLVLARAQIGAEQWAQARETLMAVVDRAPSRRVYRTMADLEHGENHDAEAARSWLLRADAAGPDEAWVCQACGTVLPVWSAVCGHCGAFDTVVWTSPTAAVHLPFHDGGPAAGSTLPPPG
ncbi:MAG: heme biosynthesis protein HemY [Rhodospirillaceae bacterium]|nr:heme biosynthesis protein HemY [Rhodospirillaceae bacterium]MCA8931694.1 heme biosynthesis protein HemY [Rhodospirillaceae bacterium]